ncbi:hypothetical protein LINPERHAP2_LOCUS41809 [Linum perenne]
MEAMSDFRRHESIPRLVNCIFLCLILKTDVIEDIKDLCMISLVTSLYKILLKTLDDRFNKFLRMCVLYHQCAFIEGMQILDASPIANELIDARRRNGRSGLILEFDNEKAYMTTSTGLSL